MKLSQLIALDKDVEITGIATDSQKVEKGNLFLCLKGEKYGVFLALKGNHGKKHTEYAYTLSYNIYIVHNGLRPV